MPIVGLEKLCYAILTKDDDSALSYDTPVYLPGVKEIGVSPKVSTEKLYAENKLWEQDTALDEVEVTINIADLSNAERATLLGHTTAAEGGVFAKDNDQAPYVALLYKANKTNDEARYQVLYKGKFELPEDKSKGKEGKTEFQTPQMKAIFQSTKNNGMWKYQVDSDDPDCPETIDKDFFTGIIIPTKRVVTP